MFSRYVYHFKAKGTMGSFAGIWTKKKLLENVKIFVLYLCMIGQQCCLDQAGGPTDRQDDKAFPRDMQPAQWKKVHVYIYNYCMCTLKLFTVFEYPWSVVAPLHLSVTASWLHIFTV